MRVIIIDDEKAVHIVLKRLLAQMDGVDVVGCYQHAAEAIEQVRQGAVDLVFIDIMIGQDNGLEVARQLRSARPELELVFLTSHKEFAADSFESYPLDYMIKPVSASRLARTIATAAAKIEKKPPAEDTPRGKLTVRTLGGFEVWSEQGELVKWNSKKSMELFAYLVMHKGKPVSKNRVIEHLFSDMPQKNAAIYLNTTVYQLRKALHALGHKQIVVHSQEQYWLLLDHLEVDFIRFEEHLSQSPWTAMDSQSVEMALACERLYTGKLFEDRSYEWSIPEQNLLHERYVRFTKQLSQLLLAQQRPEQAIDLIKKLLQTDEWDEEANLLLLQGYEELRDKVSFMRHYEHLSNLYRQELSIPISDEITQRYERFCLS